MFCEMDGHLETLKIKKKLIILNKIRWLIIGAKVKSASASI